MAAAPTLADNVTSTLPCRTYFSLNRWASNSHAAWEWMKPIGAGELRRLSAEKVLGNLNMATMNQPGYAGPLIQLSGCLIRNPSTRPCAGWHVPLMIGTNSMDIGFGFARDKEELFAPFGADREKAIAAYDPTGKGDLRTVQYQVSMDRFMVEKPVVSLRAYSLRKVSSRPPIQVFLCRKVHAQQMAGRAHAH